jgi:hypothetical protein
MGAEVERLDPESHALLELSVVRGLPDDELAGLLGLEVDRLRARREGVMRRLGADSDREREALAVFLRERASGPQPGHRAQAEPAAEPATAAQTEPAAEPGPPGSPPDPLPPAEARPRRRAILLALAGGAAIAIVVALVLALGREDSPFSDTAGPPEPEAPRTGRLEALGGLQGSGTASITGPEDRKVLRITVQGLPRAARGGYVIWLYDSISNAQALSGSRRGTFSMRTPLPPGFGRYSYLDISREAADGNRNHGGQSVLRVPLERVPGA